MLTLVSIVLLEFIATRLRELRKRHDLTQEQMAILLETDLKWYQRIESGAKDIKVSTIERFAAVFGVAAVEFLGSVLPETKVKKTAARSPHRRKVPAKQGQKR